MTLTIDNWVTIVSALGVGILGILGTLVIQTIRSKKLVVVWTLVDQNYFTPRTLTDASKVPISIKVGDRETDSLAVLRVGIANFGNEVLKDITVALEFSQNPGYVRVENPQLIHSHFPVDLGEFEKHIWLETSENDSRAKVHFDFLNQKQEIEVEFFVENYQRDAISADLAAPGVRLHRIKSENWSKFLMEAAKESGIFSGQLGILIRLFMMALGHRVRKR